MDIINFDILGLCESTDRLTCGNSGVGLLLRLRHDNVDGDIASAY